MIFVAHLVAHPHAAGHVRRTLAELSLLTAGEPGARAYDVFQDAAEPQRFTVVERYADRAAFDAHMQTAYVRRALAHFAEWLVEAPRTAVYEPVASLGGDATPAPLG